METFKMPAFKVKDLLINVIPQTFSPGGGGVGLCESSQGSVDYTPITPHTPVISVVKIAQKFKALDALSRRIEQVDTAVIEKVAVDVGRAVVAGKFVPGAALCTQEMATCDANERISPFASMGAELLNPADLVGLKIQLMDAVRAIDVVERQVEKQTLAMSEKIIPQLENAISVLKQSNGKAKQGRPA